MSVRFGVGASVWVMALGLMVGCGESGHDHGDHPHDHGHDHAHDHGHGGHHHEAPHGGALVVLGDHFAHLEVLLDAEAGKLTAWVLDGEAEKPIRLKQDALMISVTPTEPAHKNPIPLSLGAVTKALTGEKPGDSATFETAHERLKGLKRFDAELLEITVKGSEIQGVKFKYPEGNEAKASDGGSR